MFAVIRGIPGLAGTTIPAIANRILKCNQREENSQSYADCDFLSTQTVFALNLLDLWISYLRGCARFVIHDDKIFFIRFHDLTFKLRLIV